MVKLCSKHGFSRTLYQSLRSSVAATYITDAMKFLQLWKKKSFRKLPTLECCHFICFLRLQAASGGMLTPPSIDALCKYWGIGEPLKSKHLFYNPHISEIMYFEDDTPIFERTEGESVCFTGESVLVLWLSSQKEGTRVLSRRKEGGYKAVRYT